MPTISTFEELRHGLVAGPRLLLVVGYFRRLALPAGVHRFAIINTDRLVHPIPVLPFPVERSSVVLILRHFSPFFLLVLRGELVGVQFEEFLGR